VTALAASYNESQPRAENGEFGSGGGAAPAKAPKRDAQREKALAHPQVQQLMRDGFTGGIPQSGLRPESFDYLRSGGAAHGGIPTLKLTADGPVHIVDGRHRIALARERGDKTIKARVLVEGARGGIHHDIPALEIPLKPAAHEGPQTLDPAPKRKS
jgi:hypothetical protein